MSSPTSTPKAAPRRRCEHRIFTSRSSPASSSQPPTPPRCSIRECLRKLCCSKPVQTSPSSPSSSRALLDDLPPLPDSPLDTGSLATLTDQSSMTLADGVEDNESIIMLETATPQVPIGQYSLDSRGEPPSNLPAASPSSLTMASPSSESMSSTPEAVSTTLTPGRIRRRDTDESNANTEDLDAPSRSSTRSPLSIPRLSPGPELAYSSANLGQAPIPFRTSFLPIPPESAPGLTDRPPVLPILSRYTEQTEVMPSDLPIYQHYRQVRRRTEAISASSSSSGRSGVASLNGDVPRRARTRQHTAGLSRDRAREDSFNRRGDGVPSQVTTGTSGPSNLPVQPVVVPVRGPPTPPPMFMASHGFGQFPSAEAGHRTIPTALPEQSPPTVPSAPAPTPQTYTYTIAHPHSVHPRVAHHSHLTREQIIERLGGVTHNANITVMPFTTAPGPAPQPSHTNTATNTDAPSVNHDQTPMDDLPPLRDQALTRRQPEPYEWESPIDSRQPIPPPAPNRHIGLDPASESRMAMLNQFAYYHDQYRMAGIAHPGHHRPPPTQLPNMPTRTESLYSRLARLDSIRSENPVYRGEVARPYLPISESSTPGPSRRAHQNGRTAQPGRFDAHNSVIPPIPPYAHDNSHRAAPSPWSQSSSVGSRWRSMGALSAVAGDLNRPASRQENARDESLSWFSNEFPYDDVPVPAPIEPDLEEQDLSNEAGMLWNTMSTANPSVAAWDLLPHFPIDTLDSGFHDPMQPTALNHVHPFARSREAEQGATATATRTQSAPDTARFRLPEGPPRPLFEPFRLDNEASAEVPDEQGDRDQWIGPDALPPNMFPIANHIEPPPPLVHSWATEAAPGAAAYVMASGAGAQDADDVPPRQYHHMAHHINHYSRMGRFVPLHSQIPTIAPRVLSPAFLRHYRIDKNWPIEKQKHIVRVVVRLLNGFSPVHRKLEAQSVLKYVSWDEMDTVCAAREMEKESVCAVCYDEYAPGDKLAVTPCNHMYHKHCLNTWFDTPMALTSSASTSCPMCRRNLAALALITRIVWSKDQDDALPLWMATMAEGGVTVEAE